ncbi:hypothetical protein MXB_2843 [Myxobolus squamalis]|nr:hypothetical protein MXB_2843 [Myxobolus squamalis]
MYFSKITNDNNKIFGIARNLTAKIVSIETAQIINKFCNKDMIRFPAVNCAAINHDDKILLFNGDLFCTRSEKLIHSFPKFTQHLSGIIAIEYIF